MAIDPDGNVFVLDSGNDRVQKFNADGHFLLQFGKAGAGKGEFSDPMGIAIDPKGNVFISDTGNGRVQKFDSTGLFLLEFGHANGNDPGLQVPTGISMSHQGEVYVVDQDRCKVRVFDSQGKLTRILADAQKQEWLQQPVDVFCDSASQNLFIADAQQEAVLEVSRDGQMLRAYRGFKRPLMSVSTEDRLYVLDIGEADIVEIDRRSGEQLNTLTQRNNPANLRQPTGVAVDAGGDIYVVDALRDQLIIFNPDGNVRTQFSTAGTAMVRGRPEDVAVDPNGCIFVLDALHGMVKKFAPEGQLLLSFPDEEGSRLLSASGICVGRDGAIYVADTQNDRVLRFDPGGKFLNDLGSGQIVAPGDLALDEEGNIYIADYNGLQKFDPTGQLIKSFVRKGEKGAVGTLGDVAVHSETIYVLDYEQSKIAILHKNGKLIANLDGPSLGTAAFAELCHIAVDKSGNLYVTDRGNSRVLKFAPVK
jgi:DNA-binding beta-propeller fold protein YncE